MTASRAAILRMLLAAFAATMVLCTPRPGLSHALDPGYAAIEALGGEQYRVFWRRPDVQGRPMPLALRLPDECTPADAPRPRSDGRAWVSTWVAACPGGLSGGEVSIEGLENTRTDVLLRVVFVEGEPFTMRLTPSDRSVIVPTEPSAGDVALTYFLLGVEHILEGWDHLLFVFALVLLVPGMRQLTGAVTAFTVAHSITLGAATLDWVRVQPRPVEVMIALSIVFLASELVRHRDGRVRLSERWPWLVTFAFGLLHGFGFAGALREIGLPQDAVPLALLTFNLGVEAGQLLFVVAVLALAYVLRGLAGQRITLAMTQPYLAYGIGCIASFWLIERLA